MQLEIALTAHEAGISMGRGKKWSEPHSCGSSRWDSALALVLETSG